MAVAETKTPTRKAPGIRLFGHKLPLSAQIGFVIIFINFFLMIFAPFLAPYPEGFVPSGEGMVKWAPASAEHWLGTDAIGRDVLSQLLYGARLSIGLSLLTTLIAFVVGIVTGFSAAIMGRWVDILLSRFADLILSMPTLIFCLVIITVVMSREQGFVTATGLSNAFFEGMVIVFVIGFLYAVPVFRLARAVSMNIVALEYVEAARLRGENIWWVIRREVLPNSIPPLVAEFGLRFCFTFLLIASLSFLGLGIQPPYQDWGSMVNQNAQAIFLGKPQPLFAAGAIAVLTIGINLVVDWLLSVYSRAHGENA
jgi:peptide/nickel transport system permease protein